MTTDPGYERFRREEEEKQRMMDAYRKSEALHELSKTRWIAVEEGLPPIGRRVYVVQKRVMGGVEQLVAKTWGYHTNPQWSVDWRPESITHWRAVHDLPEQA
jgi:hypothetical protein